jgi:ATP-binding protein involved in chromosome partitioning
MGRELTVEAVLAALRPIQDPELHRSLVELGMIKDVRVDDGRVSFLVDLTTPACPLKGEIQSECERAIRRLPGVKAVDIRFGATVRSAQSMPGPENLIPEVRNTVLVASGKGGVGKSTVAVNLAVALGKSGARTGLLDADIYGPSIPIMMGIDDRPGLGPDGRVLPLRGHGLEVMSIGYLVDPDTAMVWRGPMLNGAVVQLLRDVSWGELDYLVVDLPPGTGDVQLTIAQRVAVAGAVVVTTPQAVALADVVRAKRMFDKVNITTLGVIENMASFVCPNCDTVHDIFARGGGERFAKQLGIPFLGSIPIDPRIRAGGDVGEPMVVAHPDSPAGRAFRDIAGQRAAHIAVQAMHAGTGSIPIRVVDA